MNRCGPSLGFKGKDGLFCWHQESGFISVSVAPEFLPERSNPESYFYCFAYTVTIKNLGFEPIQLLRRAWTITDGTGAVEQVEGEGVIGLQPWIEPGEVFSYQSGCPLRTPTGNMRGWYFLKNQTGKPFKARIPLFFLRCDNIRN